MLRRIKAPFQHLSLAQRFMLASLAILVAGMIGIGAWVGHQIERGVVNRTAATTALYVDSFVAPLLQELGGSEALTPERKASLDALLHNTPLGEQIVAFRVWDRQGRIVYSSEPATVGQIIPVEDELETALHGNVAASIGGLRGQENELERAYRSSLLEMYSPVRLEGTDQVIAVAEFYQSTEALDSDINAAQRQSWLVVGTATLVMYLLLAGFVRGASNTIVRQQRELSEQVVRLKELLAQNEELHERVRRAAARTTALNERFLRRISAELHDGPVQDVSLALLRLDSVAAQYAIGATEPTQTRENDENLNVVQNSLRHALQEVRAISAGLGVPQLDHLTLVETLSRAVRAHERRTGTKVALDVSELPDEAALPVKITLYRLVQEALNNAYRHAGGVAQRVHMECQTDHLFVEISDEGSGFTVGQEAGWDEHLGLVGMRERVESLGGLFHIESEPGRGTKVMARLPLQVAETDNNHER